MGEFVNGWNMEGRVRREVRVIDWIFGQITSLIVAFQYSTADR
jgi:hypothetical protein